MRDTNGTKQAPTGVGGLAISSADWQKIHALEGHVWARLDEARTNLWAIKKSLTDDLARLTKVGGAIKGAVIASAIVGAINTIAVISGPPEAADRSWRNRDRDDGASRWREDR